MSFSPQRKRWWVGCITFFTFAVIFFLDIWLFQSDTTTTFSYTVSEYTGASRESVASALLGFFFGAMLVHFTGWTAKPPDDK